MTDQLHVFRWKKYRPELKGQLCRVLARGKMNAALVQFESGEKVITSRNALRKAKETDG